MLVSYSGGRGMSEHLKEQRHCRKQKPCAHTSIMADMSAKIMESDKGEQGVFMVTHAIRLKTRKLL